MTRTEKKLQRAIELSNVDNDLLSVNGRPKKYSIHNSDTRLRCFNGNQERRRTTLEFACAISDYSTDELVSLINKKWA